MPDTTPSQEHTPSPTAQDIISKDVAYQNHLADVRRWETVSELDKKMGTSAAGEKPKPDQAALRGEEFSKMRAEVSKEFGAQRSKAHDRKPNSFDKLPSKIDKTANPTDKIVKMATYLDLVSDYLPKISIPGAVDALSRCPDALELTSKFRENMVDTIANLKPAFLREQSRLVDEIATRVLPLAEPYKRSEIVEVTGEIIGTGLYKSLIDSPTRTITLADLKAVLHQKGIEIDQNRTAQSAGQQLNYEEVQNLLVDEAAKMDSEDARVKALGVSIGLMSQVAEGLPTGRDRANEPRNLTIMTSVINTSGRINKETFPDLPNFFQQKLTEIRDYMQFKRNSWI